MSNTYINAKQHPLTFGDVKWTEGFYKTKENLCIENTIKSVYKGLNTSDNSAQLKNFHILAGEVEGEYVGTTHWGDGDCYKWIEAASYIWSKTRDEELKKQIDYEINAISKAQCEDGYIDTFIQLNGKERFSTSVYHEDYNFGHLFTAASVNYQVTGDEVLLNVAKKAADCLAEEFLQDEIRYPHFGWNPSQMMGLIDLYRATNNVKYLKLAEVFINLKGSTPVHYEEIERPGIPDSGGDLNQDYTPLKKETTPEGHAVTAVYLYAGAADLCLEQDEKELETALSTIGDHLYNRRIYITGGVGPQHFGYSSNNQPVREAFAHDYILPLSTAYNETCANIGNAMWNWRMYLLTDEAKYMDRFENVMYNSGLSGMSADGLQFRYTNPMKWHGENQVLLSADSYERWYTHHCYCCPPQLARTVASMERYVCSKKENELSIHLFSGCDINTDVNDKKVSLSMKTLYPWQDTVEITVNEDITDFTLAIRIPSYSKKTTVKYNGEDVACEAGSYCRIHSDFKVGDVIYLQFDLSIKKMKTNAKVEASKNQIAFMRGPVVYCLEGADLDGKSVEDISIEKDTVLEPVYKEDLFYGVTVLEGKGKYLTNASDELYAEYGSEEYEDVDLQFIPYYTWNNRGVHEMSVYIPVI